MLPEDKQGEKPTSLNVRIKKYIKGFEGKGKKIALQHWNEWKVINLRDFKKKSSQISFCKSSVTGGERIVQSSITD